MGIGTGPPGVLVGARTSGAANGERPGDDRRARYVGPPRAWFAVLVVASAAVWLALVGTDVLWRDGILPGALLSAQRQMVGPALVAVIVVVFLAERLWPAVPRPVLARAHLVDAGYLLLFALIAPLVSVMDTGFAVVIQRYAPFLSLSRLPVVPRVVVVGVMLVGIDAMNWLAHVMNHRTATLWRLHALHHSQEDMSVFTTFRTHPLAHAAYMVALLPALVLGASGTIPATALVCYGCLVTLPHANLRWTFGPLGRILVSPAYHRLHHASSPVEGRSAVNFGFVLVCWDRLARCAVYPTGGVPIRTGIGGRPVPIEQSAPRFGLTRVVVAQLIQPFTVKAATDGRP
jgi:sterol desaturase/sphingolipid hydroxylase (fatty acid hydroxylase superfamily)